MRKPTFFVTPGYGPRHLELLHYSQAVRIGDRVETSGQGGWAADELRFPESLASEVTLAFDNMASTLAAAGTGWGDVVAVETFHVVTGAEAIDAEHTALVVEQLRARTGARAPIWTQVGVAALGAPGMRVEVRATAVISEG